ncbi:MAG: nucleotidyltransferase domain-containing protein [Clostridiales bacterium]|nr:nucleotidyltransferase domain-containing protein [Clostridiales bacterium]
MCTKSQLDEILSTVALESKKVFGDRLYSVILFGSYARGDYDDDSDIDIMILVDLPAESISEYRTRIDALCGDLLLKYGLVISAIEKDKETYMRYASTLPFYQNIEREGIKIA